MTSKTTLFRYPKVLYGVSQTDFKIGDEDDVYKMSSEINRVTPIRSKRQIYWSTVSESGLIVQQVSL